MSRFSKLVLCSVAGLLVTIFLLRSFHAPDLPSLFSNPHSAASKTFLEKQRSFWLSFYPQLLRHGPQCEPIVHDEIDDLAIGYDQFNHSVSRPDRITLSENQLHKLRDSHSEFITHLKSRDYDLPFQRTTRGIVTTAGGKYLPVSVVSIRMLRATGCQLPVEVFLNSWSEWDDQICGPIFSSINARCVVLEEIFNISSSEEKPKIDKYQYKIMSIVFSSFEELLFIDSDSFPIYNPTDVFDSKPFRSTGLIRFPDFWFPSESAFFFDIAGLPLPNNWEMSGTESGELFYSKKKHLNSLLLAIYYNYYGPSFYYHLQSQGGPGEGDKETFLWSAVVFNEPFYSVKRKVDAVGYLTTAGEWRGSAMVQYDPVQDFAVDELKDPSLQYEARTTIRPLFLHCNMPKIDPASVFDDMSFGATGPTKDADGSFRRIWHNDAQASVDYFGFDLERRLWEVVHDIACSFEGRISAWEGRTGVCEAATNYWNAVFEAG